MYSSVMSASSASSAAMYTGDLSAALPDERPVTSVAVVESLSGCPPGFTVVAKTYDQDTDADLWKDGFFRRETRYLCLSKTEGISGHVVEEVAIVGERDMPPESHMPIPHTTDTGSRAWKKKQLVFKVAPAEMAIRFVVDVIILSRQKSNPDGFSLLGELNGLTVCCKYSTKARTPRRSAPAPPLPYTPSPGSSSNGVVTPNASDTLSHAHAGIDGVPFVINPKLNKSKELKHFTLNNSSMTLEELNNLTAYDFQTEYATLQQATTPE